MNNQYKPRVSYKLLNTCAAILARVSRISGVFGVDGCCSFGYLSLISIIIIAEVIITKVIIDVMIVFILAPVGCWFEGAPAGNSQAGVGRASTSYQWNHHHQHNLHHHRHQHNLHHHHRN